MENPSFFKIVQYVARAFFWGLGIFVAYFFLDSIIDEFFVGEDSWKLWLFFTILGGSVMHMFDLIDKGNKE